MSRALIAAIVAAVILALTGTAYFVTTSSQSDKVDREVHERVERARRQLYQNAALEGLNVLHNIEFLARDKQLADALDAVNPEGYDEQGNQHKAQAGWKADYDRLDSLADLSFKGFQAGENKDQQRPPPRPDVLALVDASGDVVYLNGQTGVPTAGQFKGSDGKVMIPALAEALKDGISVCEMTRLPGDVGLARVAASPIVEIQVGAAGTQPKQVTLGAVLAAYAINKDAAHNADDLLGVRVAFFDADKVSATSFVRGADEDTGMQQKLDAALKSSNLRAKALDVGQPDIGEVVDFDVDGVGYVGATVRPPIFYTKPLPADYPHQTAAMLVLVAPGDEAATFTRPAKTFILLLGIGSLALALLGMYLVHRRTEAQIDEIELGVAEIINGNLDRTFRPVGAELDGLANGLNVMLARLLGRPEPGEEAFDENGNPIIPGRVDFEDAAEGAGGAAAPAADPDLAALAQEPEPDYYKRVFTEYGAARREVGSPDDVSFESFIAKLRVNEGKLKAQYNCRAVRFRVVTKDGKVTLKPVPIF